MKQVMMNVPVDLMTPNRQKYNDSIYVTKYSDIKNSKIYTTVQQNLLVIVLKGKKKLSYKNFETVVSEGQFALFKKGNYIMNQILTTDQYESLLIFLSDDVLRKIASPSVSIEEGEQDFFQGNMVFFMKKEVASIMELLLSEESYDTILELKILELLEYIRKNDSSNTFSMFLNTCLKDSDFRETLYRKYDSVKNVKEMAALMNMSLSTFKRKFKDTFDCSPHQWLTEQKLNQAVMLLDASEYSITDIGFISGFESVSTFMAAFRKRFGISPGKYRIRHTMKKI
ncbi:MAG: helix-turn-helix domain-containing protein [Lachnospiraceae bacterium]